MSRKCEICGKSPASGNSVSHSHKTSKRTWNPNVQTVRVMQPCGNKKKVTACASCIRSGKTEGTYKKVS